MNEPLRIGLIGAGMIGQLRARAIAKTPLLRLTAVADVNLELAKTVAGSNGAVRTFSDGAALAEGADLDAVILAVPPAFHEKLGLACLQAGKHLLCEKPLATTVESCEALVEASVKAGVSLATGFNLRYTRAAVLARRLLDEGAIGELDHIRAFHGHPGGGEFTHNWICDASVSGGGALMDNGIHLIDLTRWFLGGVQNTQGFATNHVWQKPGCEDNGFLLLRNDTGRVATLQASWTEWRGYGYRLEVYGTEGFIRFGYPPMFLTYGRRTSSGKVRVKRHFFPMYQVLERARGWEWGLVETLVRDLEAWASAILSGSSQPISGADGLEAVRIALSAKPI